MKWQQKTTAGQSINRLLHAVNYKSKYLNICLKETIPPKKLLTFGHFPIGGRGGLTRIQKFLGIFFGPFLHYNELHHIHE